VVESCRDPHGCGDPGGQISHRERGADRGSRLVELRVEGNRTAVGLGDDVRSRQPGERSFAPEAIDVRVDEIGLDGRQGFVIEAQLLGDSGPVVEEDDVDLLEQAVNDLEAFGPFQIDDDALLAAIRPLEVLRVAGDGRPEVAKGLTAGRLDLDDLGSKIRELDPRVGCGKNEGELEHAHATQRSSTRVFRGLRHA
jgi:hypothetical protein